MRTHKLVAIIVGKDKEIVSTGYNSFPRGLKDNKKSRQERPEKYYWFRSMVKETLSIMRQE